MRAAFRGMLLLGFVGLAGTFTSAGCEGLPDCVSEAERKEALVRGVAVDLAKCPLSDGGGGGGGIDVSCIPSESDVPVEDACGVFVSSSKGDDTYEGTKDRPVKTLSRGLELAGMKGKPVYACGEALEEEATGVKVAAGTAIFGGLDCAAEGEAAWVYKEERRTEVSAPSDQVPVRLEKGSGTTQIADVHVIAKSAKAAGDRRSR